MHKAILITGGSGFVGSSLALSLKNDFPDSRVIALDNLKRRGSELNLSRLEAGGVEFLHGDIRNPEDLAPVPEIDLLLDCSAEPSVSAGYTNSPSYLINTNLTGTVNCLELARKYSADLVLLSTSRVYPIGTINDLAYIEKPTRFEYDDPQPVAGVCRLGISEDFPLAGTRSLYGATKLCSEHLLLEYRDLFGLRAIINRCGVITGPWQMGKVDQGVIVYWAARHVLGGSLAYYGYGGTGKQVRDILHVRDLYRLLISQLDRVDAHSGAIYNVGGGAGFSVSLVELTERCREISGRKIEVAAEPEERRGDIRCYVSDCRKVQKATGWEPSVSVDVILEEIVRWITDNRADLQYVLT